MMTTARTHIRRGAILLIVLVLLALFAVVGLAFVIYAQAEATNARIFREIQSNAFDAPPDPNPPVTAFLQQLIYPVPDGGGVTSALRGHELSRLIYGYNPNTTNNVPYSGIGLFAQMVGSIDRRNVINYTGMLPGDTVFDPEHTGSRLASAVLAGTPSTGNYVGKNAPYTYPDRNNTLLAMQDPATGQIVVPSFHRPNLFGSLDSANPNWSNNAGRYMILRPRPFDHQFDSGDGRGLVSDLPFPPANTDGTITGDVQNIRWANGVQRNDSVWIHANLPPVLYRGRYVQPLVAATILPLDGRVNFNVAGNHRDFNNGHASHHGYGPGEINPQPVLINTPVVPPVQPNEGQFLTYYRYGNSYLPMSASGAPLQQTMMHDPSIPNFAYADYSPINFDVLNGPYPVPVPTGLRTEPFYPTLAGYDNNINSGQHLSLYNPYFCTDVSTGGGRTLRLFDLRQTAYRYSGPQSLYAPPLFGFTQNDSSFTGSSPDHPSNLTRATTTTISNSISHSGVMPSFAQRGSLSYPPGNPLIAPSPSAQPQTFNPTAIPGNGDTIPGQGYRSAASLLGPLDLNRPLQDYRTNKGAPLADPVNMATMPARFPIADADRQQFAKDIFERLVVATGAMCDGYHPLTGRPTGYASAPIGSPHYNPLRYLAQLAVNIVDFVDIDDICTGFAWNPANPAEIVWGVEKTHLVVNEVYSEVTNDPMDASAPAANEDFHVRFFIELLNPLNANQNHPGPVATMSSPMGAGNANLFLGSQSVYRVQVFDDGVKVRSDLFDPSNAPANTTGSASSAAPKLTVPMPNNASAVEPNDGNMTNTGFRHMYPLEAQRATNTDTATYAVTANAAKDITIDRVGPDSLVYTVGKRKDPQIRDLVDNTLNSNGRGKHAVLLQRLANPYMAPGPNNPYITVDSMFDILVNDAIRVAEAVMPPIVPTGTRPPGTPPTNMNQSKSHGRRAPLYGYRGATPQASYAVDQRRSFLSHNTNRFQNFEWLVHHDRKLITELELLQVSGCKPHEVLHYFVTSMTGQMDPVVQPTQKQHHVAPWTQNMANLARGLEMLTVKPWMYGIPLGGRQPGRVNVNTIWHQNVLQAVSDPQNGQNTPSNNGNLFTPTDVNNTWTKLLANGSTFSRTPGYPNVGNTFDEVPTPGSDRPIKSFGVGAYTGAAIAQQDDNLLRLDSTAGVNQPAVFINDMARAPHAMQQSEMLRKSMNNLTTVSDTYMVVFTIGYFEIRSPASNARYMPVLGREVFNEIPGDLRVKYAAVIDRSMLGVAPKLTAGVSNQAPNIFMTELAADFDPRANTTQPVVLQFRAVQNAALVPNTAVVQYEGQTMTLVRTANPSRNEVNTLVIGTGGDAVAVTITPQCTITPQAADGILRVTFPAGQFVPYYPGTIPSGTTLVPVPQWRKYFAGESVSSALLGNPGPQTNFDVNAPEYKQVIRDLVPLTP